MNTAPALSEQEITQLRTYVALHRSGRGRLWSDLAVFASLPLACFAFGQWLLRWVPGHLADRGLAVCQSHQTLRKGVVWWPSEMDLATLLKAPAGVLVLCAFFMGAMALIVLVQQSKARRVAALLIRLRPELSVAP